MQQARAGSARCVRVPPPIVVGGLEHGHADARARRASPRRRARWARSRRRSPRSRGRRRRAAGRRRSPRPGTSHDSSSQGWRSTMSATSTQPSSTRPVGGVVDPVALALDVGRLGLERDDAQLAGLEPAPLLDRLEQLLVVEVAVAEVPADDDAGDQLALAHVVGLDVVDGARGSSPLSARPCECIARKARPLLSRQLGQVAVVELGQLLDDDRRRLVDRRGRASPRPRCPCGTATGSSPSCRRSSASTAGTRPARAQKLPSTGIADADHQQDRDQQRVVERRRAARRRSGRTGTGSRRS